MGHIHKWVTFPAHPPQPLSLLTSVSQAHLRLSSCPATCSCDRFLRFCPSSSQLPFPCAGCCTEVHSRNTHPCHTAMINLSLSCSSSITWSKSFSPSCNPFFWQVLKPTDMGPNTQTFWLSSPYVGCFREVRCQITTPCHTFNKG